MEQDRWIKEEADKKEKGKTSHFKSIALVGLIIVTLIVVYALFLRIPKAETLTLDKSAVSLLIDEIDSLTVTVQPEGAQPILLWESSNSDIVTVLNGVVTARSTGKAVVKAYVKDNKNVYAICEYTVIQPDVDLETIDIVEEPIVLRPGGHQMLTVNCTPENQNENILWSSTDETVARVSPRGKVEAVKVGLAYIIATSDRTGISDTASISVEGSAVNEPVEMVQDNTPQTAPAADSKVTPATTPKSATASAPKQPQATAPKQTQTTAPKSTSTNTSKSASASTAKPATTTTAKPATPKTSKSAQATAAKSSSQKDFGYATYKGSWPNDVKGRMDFKSSHVIDSKDPKGRVAEPGDYVIGEWSEGHLVQGVWYGADHKAKGSILIGK